MERVDYVLVLESGAMEVSFDNGIKLEIADRATVGEFMLHCLQFHTGTPGKDLVRDIHKLAMGETDGANSETKAAETKAAKSETRVPVEVEERNV